MKAVAILIKTWLLSGVCSCPLCSPSEDISSKSRDRNSALGGREYASRLGFSKQPAGDMFLSPTEQSLSLPQHKRLLVFPF